MKLPEIPTDNLYKFMALSGICIIMASFLPNFHAYKLRVRTMLLRSEIKKLQSQADWLKTDIKTMNHEIEKLQEAEGDEATRKVDKLLTQLLEREKLLRNIEITLIDIEAKMEELKYLSSMVTKEIWLGGIGGIVGIFLTYNGFRLWYKKLQLPQDMIISKRSKDEQNQ